MGGQALEGPSWGAHDSLDRGRDWSGQMAHLLHDSLFNIWQHELDHKQHAVELHQRITTACDWQHESMHNHGVLLPRQECCHDYSMVARS